MSDWFAIYQMITEHEVAADTADAARQALDATVDINLPDGQTYPTLVEQVEQGIVSESAIDAAVRRLLKPKFRHGLFEDPYVDAFTGALLRGNGTGRFSFVAGTDSGFFVDGDARDIAPVNTGTDTPPLLVTQNDGSLKAVRPRSSPGQ